MEKHQTVIFKIELNERSDNIKKINKQQSFDIKGTVDKIKIENLRKFSYKGSNSPFKIKNTNSKNLKIIKYQIFNY